TAGIHQESVRLTAVGGGSIAIEPADGAFADSTGAGLAGSPGDVGEVGEHARAVVGAGSAGRRLVERGLAAVLLEPVAVGEADLADELALSCRAGGARHVRPRQAVVAAGSAVLDRGRQFRLAARGFVRVAVGV